MQGNRILLVEDDFIINMDIHEHLKERGYAVNAVYCASAAVEGLDRGRRLSALVTDIDLGVGVDGFAVARCARAAYTGLPIVFMSATSAARGIAEGFAGSAFVAKPLHPRQISDALERLMAPPAYDPKALRLPSRGAVWPNATGAGQILRRRAA